MPKKSSGSKFDKFKRDDGKKMAERDSVEERRTPKKKPRTKK